MQVHIKSFSWIKVNKLNSDKGSFIWVNKEDDVAVQQGSLVDVDGLGQRPNNRGEGYTKKEGGREEGGGKTAM